MNEIDREIKKLQAQIVELEKEKTRLSLLDPRMRVTESIHKTLCNNNHVDGCGWFYESWEKFEHGHAPTRKHYYDIACKLLNHFTEQQIDCFLDCIEGV